VLLIVDGVLGARGAGHASVALPAIARVFLECFVIGKLPVAARMTSSA
jgi:hypothetical protein